MIFIPRFVNLGPGLDLLSGGMNLCTTNRIGSAMPACGTRSGQGVVSTTEINQSLKTPPLFANLFFSLRFSEFRIFLIVLDRKVSVTFLYVYRYTDAPDGDWVIGPFPGDPSLILATSGSGHGFKVRTTITSRHL